MKTIHYTIVAACSALFITGCMSGGVKRPDYAPNEQYAPKFGIVYYPRTRSLNRENARPVPDYKSWPVERMDRDINRFQDANFDIVYVVVDMEDLTEEKFPGYSVFMQKAGMMTANRPKFTFIIISDSPQNEKLIKLQNLLISSRSVSSDAWLKKNGKPLLLLGKGMESFLSRHPAFSYERADVRGTQKLLEKDVKPLFYNGKNSTVIYPVSDYEGEVSRKSGKAFRDQLRTALTFRSEVIIINAWNDFESNRFIEPNSLDQDRALFYLQDEIERLPSHQYGGFRAGTK